ncbi:MAG: hypothetical protein R3A13_12130 [Bdellovibrionota bacterium]
MTHKSNKLLKKILGIGMIEMILVIALAIPLVGGLVFYINYVKVSDAVKQSTHNASNINQSPADEARAEIEMFSVTGKFRSEMESRGYNLRDEDYFITNHGQKAGQEQGSYEIDYMAYQGAVTLRAGAIVYSGYKKGEEPCPWIEAKTSDDISVCARVPVSYLTNPPSGDLVCSNPAECSAAMLRETSQVVGRTDAIMFNLSLPVKHIETIFFNIPVAPIPSNCGTLSASELARYEALCRAVNFGFAPISGNEASYCCNVSCPTGYTLAADNSRCIPDGPPEEVMGSGGDSETGGDDQGNGSGDQGAGATPTPGDDSGGGGSCSACQISMDIDGDGDSECVNDTAKCDPANCEQCDPGTGACVVVQPPAGQCLDPDSCQQTGTNLTTGDPIFEFTSACMAAQCEICLNNICVTTCLSCQACNGMGVCTDTCGPCFKCEFDDMGGFCKRQTCTPPSTWVGPPACCSGGGGGGVNPTPTEEPEPTPLCPPNTCWSNAQGMCVPCTGLGS